jgi:predicted DNA binding CopG/RHH family protein
MTDGNDAKLTIRLPRELLEAAHEKAQRSDVPISQFLRHCLREWVAEDPPEEPEEGG